MTRSRLLLVLGCTCLLSSADGTLPPGVAHAVGDSLIACIAAEGQSLSDDDRRIIADAAPLLAPAIIAAEPRCGAAGDPAVCSVAIRALPCEALAERLKPELPAADAIETPSWAQAYAKGLVARIVACAEVEGTTTSDAAALQAATDQIALAFTLLGTSGLCSVDEGALPSCLDAMGTLSCESLGAALDGGDLEGLSATLSRCAGVLQCSADAALRDADGAR